MSNYTIVSGIGDEGFDVAIVSTDGVRWTVPNFPTEADAVAWIALDKAQDGTAVQRPVQRLSC